MKRLRINEGDAALVVRQNENQEIVLAPKDNSLGAAELTILAMSLYWQNIDRDKQDKLLKRAKAYVKQQTTESV